MARFLFVQWSVRGFRQRREWKRMRQSKTEADGKRDHDWGTVIAVLLLPVVMAGCATSAPPAEPFIEPAEPVVRLQPGDVLRLDFVYWPELNEQQAIRPDGNISLKLVGDVMAQELTPDELRQRLVTAYADKLKDPEINVVVTSYDSQRVYVGGEVRTPGVLRIQGRMTAMDAVLQAGGFVKESAKMKQVIVIRQAEGRQYAQRVNLKRALNKPESEPFYLAPRDIVYVPRTNIDRVDQWVEQYINRIIPRNTTLNMTFFKDIGPGGTGFGAGQGL